MLTSFAEVIEKAKNRSCKKVAIVLQPQERKLAAIVKAGLAGFISPVFIGSSKLLNQWARTQSPAKKEFIEAKGELSALRTAVDLVIEGKADIIVQGIIDQALFVDYILSPGALKITNHAPSYVALFEQTEKKRLMMVTDCYLNNYPDITEKISIIENALLIASVLEIENPNIAALTSIEQVNTQIPSTLDAAVLSKMSGRGRWGRTCVEGPIDIDCALDLNAALRKGVRTHVAGHCHIYMTPDIESGYALAQLLTFAGRFPTAGILVGAICPIILDVNFISDDSFMTELALASLLCESRHDT